jgi:hypothetical protein
VAKDGAGEGLPRWQVIEGTASPNGRYAIAWGLHDEPAKWAEVCASYRDRAERTYEQDTAIAVPEEKVENYVVDQVAGKLVGRIETSKGSGPAHWELPHSRPNRYFIEATWSPKSDLVVLNYTWRWDCLDFLAVSLPASGGLKVGNLLPKLQAAGLRLAKSTKAGASHADEELNVSFDEVKHVKGVTYRADVHVVAGKMWAAPKARTHFVVAIGKDGAPTVEVRTMQRR